jgi:hypothetical protein
MSFDLGKLTEVSVGLKSHESKGGEPVSLLFGAMNERGDGDGRRGIERNGRGS